MAQLETIKLWQTVAPEDAVNNISYIHHLLSVP